MFPVHARKGVYILSDASKVQGKQAALTAEGRLQKESRLQNSEEVTGVPKGYKGPICPRCGNHRVRQLSASMEAAECLEPTHRKVTGVKMLPELYACPCGKRWKAVA